MGTPTKYNSKECYDLVINNNTAINGMKGFIFAPFYLNGEEDFEDTTLYEYLISRMPTIIKPYCKLSVRVNKNDPSYMVATLVQYCADNHIDLTLYHVMGKHWQCHMTQYFRNIR